MGHNTLIKKEQHDKKNKNNSFDTLGIANESFICSNDIGQSINAG
jgi:hypothetical protein